MANEKKKSLASVSFGEAQKILSKFRYKPRREWTKEDRITFKVCNFAVLSKKRLNKIFHSLKSFARLSDKSHYKYTELDIIILKELILDNLSACLEEFNIDVKIYKQTDVKKIQYHHNALKNENLRLQNEIKRLQFIIENYINETNLQKINDIKELLKIKLPTSNAIKSQRQQDLIDFDEENLKEFMKGWKTGKTSSEIRDQFKKENLDIKKTRKKRFKL